MENTDNHTLKTLYTFTFGRNLYTVRLKDIKKVTLLEHKFIQKADDTEDVQKSLYIFSVVGELIPNIKTEEDKPVFDTIMEVKAEESDYSNLYEIYESLVITWDKFQESNQ